MTESKIQIGMSQEFLETSKLTNAVGEVHREGVFIGDPLNVDAKVAVDEHSSALVTIESEHHRIHQGEGYTASGKATIANVGGEQLYLLDNTNGTHPHFRELSVNAAAGPMDLYLYEAPTTSDNGTQLATLNNNRNSTNASVLDLYTGPTVSGNGTQLEYFMLAGTKKDGGTVGGVPVEWILKPATKYLIRIVNNVAGAGNTDIGFHMFWYEGA